MRMIRLNRLITGMATNEQASMTTAALYFGLMGVVKAIIWALEEVLPVVSEFGYMGERIGGNSTIFTHTQIM